MNDAAIRALHALRDVGCVSASVANPGYSELKRKGLVWTTADTSSKYRPVPHLLYRLSERGKALAAEIL